MLYVVLRTNDKIESVNGNRTLGKKSDITKRSFTDLLKAIEVVGGEKSVSLVICRSQLSSVTQKWMDKKLESQKIAPTWIDCEIGNKISAQTCIGWAIKNVPDNDLVLFCEDDYYWNPKALDEIIKFYGLFDLSDNNVIINPCLGESIRPECRNEKFTPPPKKTIIIPSAKNGLGIYWAQCNYSTMTFAMNGRTLRMNKPVFDSLFSTKQLWHNRRYGMYDRFLCFTPLFSLCEHIQTEKTVSWLDSKHNVSKNPIYRSGIIDMLNHIDLRPTDTRRIIVSMTTMPSRIERIEEAIQSLENQTLKPDQIVLYISKQDFQDGVPEHLKKIEERHKHLTIKLIDENYGVATKIIPALADFPNDIIINADDDLYYKPDVIKNLYQCYLKNPNSIITVCARKVLYDGKTFFVNEQSDYPFSAYSSSYNNSFCSGHGTLYPPHIFDGSRILDYDMMKKCCPTNDELWMWANALTLGVKVVVCGDYKKLFSWLEYKWNYPTALSHTVNTRDKSNEYFSNLFKFVSENSNFDPKRLGDSSYGYDNLKIKNEVKAPTPKPSIKPNSNPAPAVNSKPIPILSGSRSYGTSLNRFRNFDFSKVH